MKMLDKMEPIKKPEEVKTCQGGYSIWLMPEGDVYRRLGEWIYKLSEKTLTALFEPHVTLIGELRGGKEQIREKTRDLASRVNLNQIELAELNYSDEYYRRFFLRVNSRPELVEARREAERVFKVDSQQDYFPHLSLAYGELSKEIADKVISKLSPFKIKFNVNSLYLFSTKGKVHQWYKIDRFKLRK